MTVREIAGRIGVSPSLIPQSERDRVTPSVSTLWALVTDLGLAMGDVFPDVAPGAASPRPAAVALPVRSGDRARLAGCAGAPRE